MTPNQSDATVFRFPGMGPFGPLPLLPCCRESRHAAILLGTPTAREDDTPSPTLRGLRVQYRDFGRNA